MTSASTFSEASEATASPAPMPADDAWTSLPRQMPAAATANVWLHGDFPGQRQVRVIASQAALGQMVAHAQSDLSREVGGVLLGQAMRHQAQTFVEVRAALPAFSPDHGPVHFTFTADTWAAINQAREQQYPALDIVGWFHTHPRLGVFYSADDVVVHSAAFTLPWQVGLVIDPVLNQASFFGWEQGRGGSKLAAVAGFYEWLDEQDQPQVDWQVTHHPRISEAERVLLPAPVRPMLSPISPWWGVLLGGLSLALSLGLLLERWLAP